LAEALDVDGDGGEHVLDVGLWAGLGSGNGAAVAVGTYHNPPEKAVVLCVDEKSGAGPLPADDAGRA
jgi:hypothetical protein